MRHLPSLFDRDSIDWQSGEDETELFTRLAHLRKDALFAAGAFRQEALPNGVVRATYSDGTRQLCGIFCPEGRPALVRLDLPNGTYVNLIDGTEVEVHAGMLGVTGEPVIIRA